MKLSRRDFIHAGCTVAVASLAPHFIEVAKAGINNPGSAVSVASFGRSVLGVGNPGDMPFMNFFKGANGIASSTANYPGILSADGYPTSTPVTEITGIYNLPSTYYGRYRLQFSGTGSLWLDGGFIIYSGSGFVNLGALTFSLQINNQTNPVVEFAFGTLVSGAANNGSGLIRLTVGSTLNVSTGAKYTVQGVTGTTEANGLWTITVIDATHMDLQGSTFANAYVSGGEAIARTPSSGFHFPNTGTYSGMSAAILCRKGDIDGTNPFGLQNGYQANADFVSFVKAVKPRYLRWLDLQGVVNAAGTDDSKRQLVSAFAYLQSYFVPSYWAGGTGTAGTITKGTADAYTCANPSASGAGAYADGEIVQGAIDLTNVTMTPTLNIASRGAKPIFENSGASYWLIGGSFGSGHTINLTFTGSYIAGSPFTLSYTTVAGDTSGGALGLSLRNAINANSTLIAANITADASQGALLQIVYNRNAGSGTTFTFTSTGSETMTFGTMRAGNLTATGSTLVSFTYNKVLGGWVASSSVGLQSGVATPVEVICEVCNRANINPWFEIPLQYSIASVAAMTTTISGNLNANLMPAFELCNEVWNSGFLTTGLSINLGACLGFSWQGGVGQWQGFFGLRVRQNMAQIATTWTGSGRTRASLKCLMTHSFGAEDSTVGGSTQIFRFNGSELKTANTTYMALGGPSATAGTDYTTLGQRPIDVCDAVSYAIYLEGAQLGFESGSWFGLVSDYSVIFQASKDYAAGSTALGLNAVDADIRTGTIRGGHGINMVTITPLFSLWETLYATYDTPRAGLGLAKLDVYNYEGGYESCVNAGFTDFNNATDLTAQFNANSWNTSTYGASNAIVAQNVVTLFYAYKASAQFQATIQFLFSTVVSAHAARTAYPAWYKTSGNGPWALMPSDIYTLPYYTSYNALVAFNA